MVLIDTKINDNVLNHPLTIIFPTTQVGNPDTNNPGTDNLDTSNTKISAITCLNDLSGTPFILYFYPRDNTPGCTKQACALRDSLHLIAQHGVRIFGVSKDATASHEKFIQKQNLNFPLISDTDGTLCEAFGVWREKSLYGKKYMGIHRATFFIDHQLQLHHAWEKIPIATHWDDVLYHLNNTDKPYKMST